MRRGRHSPCMHAFVSHHYGAHRSDLAGGAFRGPERSEDSLQLLNSRSDACVCVCGMCLCLGPYNIVYTLYTVRYGRACSIRGRTRVTWRPSRRTDGSNNQNASTGLTGGRSTYVIHCNVWGCFIDRMVSSGAGRNTNKITHRGACGRFGGHRKCSGRSEKFPEASWRLPWSGSWQRWPQSLRHCSVCQRKIGRLRSIARGAFAI